MASALLRITETEGECNRSCVRKWRVCVGAGPVIDPRKVLIIAGHHNWIVAAYAHFVICYR